MMEFSRPTTCILSAIFGSMIVLTGCSGPSGAELKNAKDQCVSFYKRERASPGEYVKAVDHWMKDGKLVIELARMESENSTSYKQGLCIYDEKKGTLSIPGLFENSRWEK